MATYLQSVWKTMTAGNKTALIFGISGQDGSYLARLLLRKGYRVAGTSRDASMSSFANLRRLGILDQVECFSVSLIDFRSVLQVISSVRPDEIYNLAGQSSVGLSFEQPVETFDSIAIGTINLLEVLRFLNWPTRLYNACSSECFGNVANRPFTEQDPFNPRSPYAVAKAAAFLRSSRCCPKNRAINQNSKLSVRILKNKDGLWQTRRTS